MPSDPTADLFLHFTRFKSNSSMVDFDIFQGVHGATVSIFFIELEGTFNIVHLKFHINRFISSKVMNYFLLKKDKTKGDQNWTSSEAKSAPTEIS